MSGRRFIHDHMERHQRRRRNCSLSSFKRRQPTNLVPLFHRQHVRHPSHIRHGGSSASSEVFCWEYHEVIHIHFSLCPTGRVHYLYWIPTSLSIVVSDNEIVFSDNETMIGDNQAIISDEIIISDNETIISDN